MTTAQHQVIGQLTRNAEARVCIGGAWVLMLEMRQAQGGAKSEPIVAIKQCGSGEPARAAAHSAAARLRQGAMARVYCTAFRVGRNSERRRAIELTGVDSVQPIQE
jgi:hypothetical protein